MIVKSLSYLINNHAAPEDKEDGICIDKSRDASDFPEIEAAKKKETDLPPNAIPDQ